MTGSELDQWRAFKVEMENHEQKLQHLAESFSTLKSFEEAARCLIKAETIKYAIARMPKEEESTTVSADSLDLHHISQVLSALVSFAREWICLHENTHRGGSIWEICSDCGAKWADDHGGKPHIELPQPIADAEAMLASVHKAIK